MTCILEFVRGMTHTGRAEVALGLTYIVQEAGEAWALPAEKLHAWYAEADDKHWFGRRDIVMHPSWFVGFEDLMKDGDKSVSPEDYLRALGEAKVSIEKLSLLTTRACSCYHDNRSNVTYLLMRELYKHGNPVFS